MMIIFSPSSFHTQSAIVFISGSNKGVSDGLQRRASDRQISCLEGSRPGVGYSNGKPYAASEAAFAAAVFNFARLVFNRRDLHIHSWSLGGFGNAFLRE